jgi:Ca2+-binding RTX toxin-like protein
MPIEATTQTSLGPVYILHDNEDLHVGTGVTLRSAYVDPDTRTGADAILSWAGTHRITIDGSVYGADEAINLVGCVSAQTVIINAGGQLFGGGDGVVEDADGVILDGMGTTLTNAGRIAAWGSAISAIVPDAGAISITNTGVMVGRVSGIWHKFGNGTLNFTNSGTVESPNASFLGGSSIDNVTNRGTMIGLVDLAGGNDLYDGRGGRVTGTIQGGAGDDRFIAGSYADVMDGGEGFDTLDLSSLTSSVTINLIQPSVNSGTAVAGDSYIGFEAIVTGSGNDRLTGTDAANTLTAGNGYDQLWGGAGADVLNGGSGKDTLSGGSDADQFLFLTNALSGDIITDFNAAEDKIILEGSAFGYGATTGTLSAADFVISSTRSARDSSDHFIFRTTDATLWFDADGSGWRGPVMIADLQAGATMSALSIEFV